MKKTFGNYYELNYERTMVIIELLHFAFCFILYKYYIILLIILNFEMRDLIFNSLESAQEDANSKNVCSLNSQAAKCEFFHIVTRLCSFDHEGVIAGSWHPHYPTLKFYEEIDFDTFERLKRTHRKNVLS